MAGVVPVRPVGDVGHHRREVPVVPAGPPVRPGHGVRQVVPGVVTHPGAVRRQRAGQPRPVRAERLVEAAARRHGAVAVPRGRLQAEAVQPARAAAHDDITVQGLGERGEQLVQERLVRRGEAVRRGAPEQRRRDARHRPRRGVPVGVVGQRGVRVPAQQLHHRTRHVRPADRRVHDELALVQRHPVDPPVQRRPAVHHRRPAAGAHPGQQLQPLGGAQRPALRRRCPVGGGPLQQELRQRLGVELGAVELLGAHRCPGADQGVHADHEGGLLRRPRGDLGRREPGQYRLLGAGREGTARQIGRVGEIAEGPVADVQPHRRHVHQRVRDGVQPGHDLGAGPPRQPAGDVAVLAALHLLGQLPQPGHRPFLPRPLHRAEHMTGHRRCRAAAGQDAQPSRLRQHQQIALGRGRVQGRPAAHRGVEQDLLRQADRLAADLLGDLAVQRDRYADRVGDQHGVPGAPGRRHHQRREPLRLQLHRGAAQPSSDAASSVQAEGCWAKPTRG